MFAQGRKKHNQLKKLKDKDGNWHDNKEEINQIITDYLSDLFETSGPTKVLSEREKVG